jgi:lipoprotein signal peptidase
MTVDARIRHRGPLRIGDDRGQARHPGHPRLVPAVLAAVVLVDQGTKWWAWRNLPAARINPGGDQLVGHQVGTWYSAQVSGAVLDVQGAIVLGLAVWLLVRVSRRLFVVPATMTVAGWGSNALDRLGLHFWTAPGSARGAVDFIPMHHGVYNVADCFIIAGTAFLLVTVGRALLAGRGRLRVRLGPAPSRRRRGPFAGLSRVVAAAALVAAVAFGAVRHTGLTRPEAAGRDAGVVTSR